MQDMLDKVIEYGYVILFLYSLGGGMLALLAAAILCHSTEELNIYVCILLAFLANYLGTLLTYYFSRAYKKEFKRFASKHRRKIALLSLKMKRHDIIIILTQKYIYGMKSFVPMVAGFIRMPFLRFAIINIFACLLWAIILGSLGFAFAPFIKQIFIKLAKYPYLGPLFLVVLTVFFLLFFKFFASKKPR